MIAASPARASEPLDAFGTSSFAIFGADVTSQPGLIYFQQGGDIVALDPCEGEPKTIAGGREPASSHDGRRLAYVRDSGGTDQLVVSDAHGSNAEPVLTGSDLGRPAWSRDGRQLAVTELEESMADIRAVDVENGGTDTVAEDLEGIGRTLSYSPDGTRLAFDQTAAGGGPARTRLARRPALTQGARRLA